MNLCCNFGDKLYNLLSMLLHNLTQSYTILHNLTQSCTILHNLTLFDKDVPVLHRNISMNYNNVAVLFVHIYSC